MIMSRPRKKIEHDVKLTVMSEIQIRFFFKSTNTKNDENANYNDGLCSEYFVYEGKSSNFLCIETVLQFVYGE